MMSDETKPTPAGDDEEQDDTVQGVARRAEKERAEAERLQREQNEAAGLGPPEGQGATTEGPPPGDTGQPANRRRSSTP